MRNILSILTSYIRYKNPVPFKTPGKMMRYQQKKLKKHLKFLKKNSPLFSSQKGSFDTWPLMDKQVMMEKFNILNTRGIQKEEALAWALKAEREREFSGTLQGLTVGLSSGTSGHRGLFVTSREEVNKWTGAILARGLGKLLKKQKIAFFLRANSNLYENVGSRRIEFRYYDIFKDLEEHIQDLRSYQPQVLVAPPSVLIPIARAVEEGRLSLKLDRLISVAEVLEPSDRRYFARVFRQEKVHQIYQATEGFLGYTCREGTLHLNEDMILFEKEYLDRERFIPIISDFTRKTQPIIRYRLNDILRVKQEPCPCGSPFLAIEQVEGREDDCFLFPGIDRQEVRVFPDILRRMLLQIEGIRQYRICQKSAHLVEIALETREDWNLWGRIEEEFRALAERMHFPLPRLEQVAYQMPEGKKMKRIERLCSI